MGAVPVIRPDLARDDIRLADEIRDEFRGRRLVKRIRAAVLRDLALVHDDDAVGNRQSLVLIMGNIDGGEAKALLQLADFGAHATAQAGVEVRQRLVQQKDLRLQHQSPRYRDALLLAARQFGRKPFPETAKAHEIEALVGRRLGLGPSHPAGFEPVGDVFDHRHMWKKRIALKDHRHVAPVRGQARHILSPDQDAARAWRFQPREHPKRRGFPAARRAQKRDQLARLDRQVEVRNRGKSAVILADRAEFDTAALRIAHAFASERDGRASLGRRNLRWPTRSWKVLITASITTISTEL